MISDILLEGEQNALTGSYICGLLGVDSRTLRQAIERERRQGVPICSSSGSNPGYYLAANKREMENFCRSLEHRAGEIHTTRRACQKTIKTLPE